MGRRMTTVQTDDVKLLVELGFIALSAGLPAEAEAIFDGVAAARPGQEAGPLGLALTAMACGDLDRAVDILKRLPPSDAAMTYLGMAFARRGDNEDARSVLRTVVETAQDASFAALSSTLLAEMPVPRP